MSKQIDLTQPLSDEDREYLKQRGQLYLVERNDLEFASQESQGVPLDPNASPEDLLKNVPNTGDVNTLQRLGDVDPNLPDAEVVDKPYSEWLKKDLLAEIAARNEEYEKAGDEYRIKTDDEKNDTLAAALEADDDRAEEQGNTSGD